MDWSNLISPVLAIVGSLLGSYLILRQNRPLIAAQVAKAVAEAGFSKATTRQTDLDNAADLISLYKASFEDVRLRMTTMESSQAAKDLVNAALVTGLTTRVDTLLVLGAEQKQANDKVLLELGNAQKTIEALKNEVAALREQLLGLGQKPGPEAVEAAAQVKATQGETAAK